MIVAVCVNCGDLYSGYRKKAGYDTCLDCGDAEAQKQIEHKNKCSAPLFNKGPYGYVANKKVAKDVGK